MELLPLNVTPEQRANLETLLANIQKPENQYIDFTMSTYCRNDVISIGDPNNAKSCGTAGCLAGHGPMCGIHPKRDEEWDDYVFRVFCPEFHATKQLALSAEFVWLFSPYWSDRDNTLKGATLRLEFALENGIPLNYIEQLGFVEPYMFADQIKDAD